MLKAEEERYALRIYVTDALMAISESCAGSERRYMAKRWATMGDAPGPERAPVDIVREVMRGAGLKFRGR